MIRINLVQSNPWIRPAIVAGVLAALSLNGNLGWESRAPSSSSPASTTSSRWILTGSEAEVAHVSKKFGLKSKSLFSRNEIAMLKKLKRSDLASARTVEFESSEEALRVRKRIRSSGAKVGLQPDFKVLTQRRRTRRRAQDTVRATGASGDPFFPEQWALKNTGTQHVEFIDAFRSKMIQGVAGEDVHLPQASKEGQGIVVAVLDTGVDLKHPDLENQIHTKPGECKALMQYLDCIEEEDRTACDAKFGKIDTDGNGYPMDCYGWNMLGEENPETGVIGDQEMMDPAEIAHGSHVAGIIAAQANNGIGIRGIAPKAKILPVRVINTPVGKGEGSVADEADASSLISVVVRGMLYAVASKANVINLSLGWDRIADSFVVDPDSGKPLMQDAVDLARSQGVLVVSSAGNDSTDALVYPCQYSGVICVGALEPNGKIAELSNYGSGVEIAAPGHGILSAMPLDYNPEVFTDRRGYDFLDGTSMASPFVAGAAAVLMSEGYSADETYARLIAGARKQPLAQKKLVLSGSLDVEGALGVKPKPLFAPVVKGVSYALWNPTQDRIRLKVKLKNLWAPASNVSVRLSSMDSSGSSGFYRLEKTEFTLASWPSGEERIFETEVVALDRRLTSEILIRAEIRSGSETQVIRSGFIVSTEIDREGRGHPDLQQIPILGGNRLQNSEFFTLFSLDGKTGTDYIALAPEGRFQIIRQTEEGYVFGPMKAFPQLKRGAIRTRQRLDLNGDGKSEYVVVFVHDGERDPESKSQRPPTWFTFFYLDENGNEVYPPSVFKNQVAEVDLERFQWLSVGGRKVPAWIRTGTTPAAEKPTSYHPGIPKPKDDPRPRLYYHDPATSDGLRSLKAPARRYWVGMLQQSVEQREKGEINVVLMDSYNYTTNFFVMNVGENLQISSPVSIAMGNYRNWRLMEAQAPVVLSGESIAGMAYLGESGVTGQGISALVDRGEGFEVADHSVRPSDVNDFAYKVMGTFLEMRPGKEISIASFSQANYTFLYQDSTIERPVETSLRRYTFVPGSMFLRLIYPVVAESDGQRLPALFIGDGFGAYLGAEIIAPLRDRSGLTVDLVRPAYLRFINRDPECEWLEPLRPTRDSPSQAVYFCGDRFLRIPYRF